LLRSFRQTHADRIREVTKRYGRAREDVLLQPFRSLRPPFWSFAHASCTNRTSLQLRRDLSG